jgi:hypothetical protein
MWPSENFTSEDLLATTAQHQTVATSDETVLTVRSTSR